MRSSLAVLVVLVVAACGDNRAQHPDGGLTPHVDAKVTDAKEVLDAKEFLDAPISVGDGIAAAKATVDGTGLTLAINDVTVTYVKPLVAGATAANDPAGFTIQATKTGPALFVAVDPATLTPVLVKGDVVSFTITTLLTTGGQKRATAIAGLTRSSQGADLAALTTDVTTATDLVTALDAYDSKLLSVTGTFHDDVATSGAAYSKFTLDTTGITGNTSLQFRVPTALVTSAVLTIGCQVHASGVVMGRFNTTAEIQAFDATELTLTCAPAVRGVTPTSATAITIAFTRPLDPTTVLADASQFHITGLTLSNAVATGSTVTLTTSAQTAGSAYTVNVDAGIKDAQANTGAAATATFTGFVTPATVKINELNANIASGCDLVELRVTAGGSMAGFKLNERDATVYTFPADFNVAKNDFILVHFNGGSATCNPGTATTETTINGQAAATYAGNVDTAYDFWIADTGITATDNVITLTTTTNSIVDVIFLDDATDSAATGTLTAANLAGTANAWLPASTAYALASFTAAAVKNLAGTGTSQAGTSIQRISDTDTDGKADWTTGAGAVSTWGAINVGQALIP